MKHTLKLTLLIVITFSIILAGCGNAVNNDATGNNDTTPPPATANKEITLAYVAWDSEIASTYVVKHVLENNLNYEVDMLQVDAGPMWAGVAGGSADAMVAAWLPSTHEHYYEDYEDELEDLGVNLDGTRVGLVVPTYMDINSIEDLKGNDTLGEQMNYTITGIEPGAGIMSATFDAIEQYELEGWSLLESSSAGMAAELSRAVENEEPVIVTGWTPHWMFASFDLKYLEDPLNIYGGDEQIHTIVRQGLNNDQSEAYAFLNKFSWTADDMAEVMVDINEGATPEQAAADWVEANEETVNEWIQ